MLAPIADSARWGWRVNDALSLRRLSGSAPAALSLAALIARGWRRLSAQACRLWQAAMGTGAKAAGAGLISSDPPVKAQAPSATLRRAPANVPVTPLTGAARGPGRPL